MEQKKKAAFITLGCKVNIAETEGMKRLFKEAGYTVVEDHEYADVYIVNTCTVTSMGDKKSRQMLRRAHTLNPNAIIAAVGCFAQVAPDEVAKIEGVNLVIGNNMKHDIVELVGSLKPGERKRYVKERKALSGFEELPIETYRGHTRAFLKIQDGCDQFCSYCIIPYARGPVRSRETADIMKEAGRFARKGFKEIVLTGIHLTSFGNRENGTGLSELIREIQKIEGIERIRLGSLEPMFLTKEFIEGIKALPKLCPHFHLSLQSGCGDTLKRMNRRYTPEEYRTIVEALREHIADVNITTDVMVGFPGETDEEFQESYDFCKEMGFLWMHVFKYSPRKGTPAARFPGQVDGGVKELRSKKMIGLAEQMRKQAYESFSGREMKVLLEQPVEDGPGYMEGHTSNYLPVNVRTDSMKSGEMINVRLDYGDGDRMTGIPQF